MLSAEVIHSFDEEILKTILHIEHQSFPEGWQYAESDYKEILMAKDNINIILRNNGEGVGCLFAEPHNKAVKELRNDDPEMKEDTGRYYIDTAEILPDFRGGKGFLIICKKFIKESKKRGISKISMHARVTNNLSKAIQRIFKITELRRIERWKYYKSDEPTDYIEANIKEK